MGFAINCKRSELSLPGDDPMNLATLTDRELLARFVGESAAKRHRGPLPPMFLEEDHPLFQKCAVARELVMRCASADMKARTVFASPDAVKNYLKILFAGRGYESFVVLYVDAQHRLITVDEIFRGTLTQTSVYPREIVKAALRENAAAVILSHNHPSGVAEPSRADELLTQTLKQALALVDVRVLDHIVVAGAGTISFAERGLL